MITFSFGGFSYQFVFVNIILYAKLIWERISITNRYSNSYVIQLYDNFIYFFNSMNTLLNIRKHNFGEWE